MGFLTPMLFCCGAPKSRPMSTRKLRLRQGKGLVNTRKKFPPRKAGEDNEDNEDNEEDGRPYYVDEDPEAR